MNKISQTYQIKAPRAIVWEALVDPKIIEKWGGGPAQMNAKVGAKFSLWGGEIYGTNTKIISNKILCQDWFEGKWNKPSKVTFTLSEKNNITTLELLHTDFPAEEKVELSDGWEKFYCGPLKDLIEKSK